MADNRWIERRLRQLRKPKQALAEALGVSPSRITALIKGERRVDAMEIGRLAKALEFEPATVIAALQGLDPTEIDGLLTATAARGNGASAIVGDARGAQAGSSLGQLLRAARGSQPAAALANFLGISERTLSNYELGKSLPKADLLFRFSEATGAPYVDLLRAALAASGITGIRVTEVLKRGRLPKSITGAVMVPRLDLAAAAKENWPDYSEDAELIDVPLSVLRRMAGGDVSRLRLLAAEGDAMEPTIRDGDLLLVDTAARDVVAAGIYVLATNGEASVKRLERLPDGGLWVKSDNGAYPERTLPASHAARATIAGRVRAVWHVL